jgi:RNA polymerase sigma-70 factor (ECF subfamily)
MMAGNSAYEGGSVSAMRFAGWMNQINVEQAIQRVQEGCVEEYRSVVLAFHSRLRALVTGLCPPGVEADEVAHCAFVEAYRRINQYQLNTNFFAWLSAIARNLLRAECEKIQRRSRNEHNYLDYLLVQYLDSALREEPALLAARSRFLAECISQLDERARSLLIMRYNHGLRVQEIARRLARSVSAVSVQLFTLRKALRGCVRRKLAQSEAGIGVDIDYGPA